MFQQPGQSPDSELPTKPDPKLTAPDPHHFGSERSSKFEFLLRTYNVPYRTYVMNRLTTYVVDRSGRIRNRIRN